jgi:glycerophosphoryl diester phosphodiesterase
VGSRHPYLDAPLPLAFAHRGGAAAGDENTMAAFSRAVGLGYRYLETDVHATADGVPVMFHDEGLQRLTGQRGRIGGLRWADLCTVRVGGAAVIPRLEDALDAWPEVRFNIDVKVDGGVEPTVAAVRRVGARDRVLLASFSDARLARLRAAAGPGVATSLGVRGVARLRVAALTRAWSRSEAPRGRRARRSDLAEERDYALPVGLPPSVVAAQVPVRYGRLRVLDRRFLRYAHRLGLQVHAWTIDEPAEMGELLDLGVDGIMTDHVDVLRDVYARRGHWPAA